jgi:hypothetical protein
MAHAKAYLKYHAYEALNGKFPRNIVIMYYKGLGVRLRDFKQIDREMESAS